MSALSDPTRGPMIPSAAWEPYRTILTELYLDQRLKLKDIVSYMASNHSFHANEGQYKRMFNAGHWNIRKYARREGLDAHHGQIPAAVDGTRSGATAGMRDSSATQAYNIQRNDCAQDFSRVPIDTPFAASASDMNLGGGRQELGVGINQDLLFVPEKYGTEQQPAANTPRSLCDTWMNRWLSVLIISMTEEMLTTPADAEHDHNSRHDLYAFLRSNSSVLRDPGMIIDLRSTTCTKILGEVAASDIHRLAGALYTFSRLSQLQQHGALGSVAEIYSYQPGFDFPLAIDSSSSQHAILLLWSIYIYENQHSPYNFGMHALFAALKILCPYEYEQMETLETSNTHLNFFALDIAECRKWTDSLLSKLRGFRCLVVIP